MKKIFSILMTLALAAAYTSCSNEVDDIFDKSSAERINEALTTDKQILQSAPNGWMMQYYGNKEYGGYNVRVKFNGDNVTVSNEVYGDDKSATSHYKLEQSQGVILSFDEYNEYFHFFSNPDNPAGLGAKGKGMEGDLEFRILSASSDSIVLKGKKHGSRVVMTPVAADFNWAAYCEKVLANEELMCANSNYEIVTGSETVKASLSYRCFSVTRTGENGDVYTETVPFIVNDEGISLYMPITVGGETIRGFRASDTEGIFPELQNSNIKLNVVYPPINEIFVSGMWATSMSNIGDFGREYWTVFRDGALPWFNQYYPGTLSIFYFGSYDGNFGAIYVLCGFLGINGFDYELIGEDQVKLKYNSKDNPNGSAFNSYGIMGYLLAPFGTDENGKAEERTFKITSDNDKKPTVLTLTDLDNKDNVITLTQEDIANPLNN